jgi:hypothetical protein
MDTLKKILITSTFAVMVAAFAPVAQAGEGNWATKVIINAPMEIGDLILAPGTYVFRLADIWAPDAVQIYSADAHHYDGMVIGIPAYRSETSEKPTFILKQGVKGAPEKLQYWYYSDHN